MVGTITMLKQLRSLLIFLFVFNSMKTNAQLQIDPRSLAIDSLSNLLPSLHGEDAIDCLNNLSVAYYTRNTDTAFALATGAFNMSARNSFM